MYSHYKHRNLGSKEKAILRNTSNLKRINNHVEVQRNGNKKKVNNIGLINTIDRQVSIAMGGVSSLPRTELETFETIWFNLKEKIEDFSRNENIDENTEQLIAELMSSEEYKSEAQIESYQEICEKLGCFSSIVDRYLD